MKITHVFSLLVTSLFTTASLFAHCQIPCGIYDDELVFSQLEQDVETIDKSGKMIRELSAKEPLSAQDHQQLVRWTTNKDAHAQKIMDQASNYFLAQRIKPDAENYAEKVKLLQLIILYSMNSKQSVESEPVEKLSQSLAEFKKLYFDHSHAE
jgi:nickel superoxide dismutase